VVVVVVAQPIRLVLAVLAVAVLVPHQVMVLLVQQTLAVAVAVVVRMLV
jgi:hypothetical protein